MADFSDSTLPLTLMGYVYPDHSVAAEGSASEEKAGKFAISVFTRRDLHDAIRPAVPRNPAAARLKKETLRHFRKNGLALPDDSLLRVRALKEQITQLEVRFSANLNNDTSAVVFSAQETRRCPRRSTRHVCADRGRPLPGHDQVP